jgi:hypothetical protein
MPRKRPKQLRAAGVRLPDGELPRIPFVSRRAVRRLAEVEQARGWRVGEIGHLLRAWNDVRRLPGRPLYLSAGLPCPCPGCDPLSARLDLALRLEGLPRRERALIADTLRRTDGWYAARTLPDPCSRDVHWFCRRLTEQDGWGRI